MRPTVSRRSALQLGAAAPLGYLFTGPAWSVARAAGSNDRLRVAGIGVGGKGWSDIEQAAQVMDVAALCDIDSERLHKRAATWPKARTFADYRKLFDEMMKEIDAVIVSTPDHSHALPSVTAIRAGKHVYCQKPLAHTPYEARVMRLAAAKAGVVTQMGNQGSGSSGLRRAVELVRGGLLGGITEAHIWTNRPFKYWKQSPDVVSRPETAPVPPYVHWDEWIGPAPFRPYAARDDKGSPGGKKPAYHPHDWRGYWDFGTGSLGDMACHTANLAFRALELDAPTAVVAENGAINPETYPAWAHITYYYPARNGKPPVAVHWYEGAREGKRFLPPAEVLAKGVPAGKAAADSGSLLIGTKAVLYSPSDYGEEIHVTPDAALAGMQTKRPEHGPEGVAKDTDPYMKREWVEAIRAGKPAMASSSFEIAGRLTEAMLLGNIAVRSGGQKLEWDAASLTFTNSPAATKLVRPEYRAGWVLPEVG